MKALLQEEVLPRVHFHLTLGLDNQDFDWAYPPLASSFSLSKFLKFFFQLNSQYFILAIIDIEILEFYANHNFKSILASLHFVLLLLPLNEAEKI